MPSDFNCLIQFDRCQLQALKKSGFPQRGIAAEISCSQSTVSRELARNTGLRGCRSSWPKPGGGTYPSGPRSSRKRPERETGKRTRSSASGAGGTLVPLVDRAVMIHAASTG